MKVSNIKDHSQNWINNLLKSYFVQKRQRHETWSLPRRRLPEAGDENTKKAFMASSTHMSSLIILFHKGIQRGGSRSWLQRVLCLRLNDYSQSQTY